MGPFYWLFGGHAWILMVVAIVAITSWSRYREKELQAHQELRMREMEHPAQDEGVGG